MSLRIDLLLDSEQRSASAFNMAAVLRVLSVVGPAVLVLGILLIAVNFYQLKLEVDRLENVWLSMEPEKHKAEELRNQASTNRQILEDLKSAARANLLWEKQLIGVMRITPLNIQLRKFAVSQSIVKEKGRARRYRITVEGKAVGPTSDRSVETLKDRFLTAPPFAQVMESAVVSSYGVDTAGASPSDRAFRIDCQYQPRAFDEASAR